MAAFTHHFAVCLRINLWDMRSHRGQRLWKFDRQLFEDERGLRLRCKYMGWTGMVRQTRHKEHPYTFMREGQEHSRTASLHEFYLTSVYDFYETLGRIQLYWHDSIS